MAVGADSAAPSRESHDFFEGLIAASCAVRQQSDSLDVLCVDEFDALRDLRNQREYEALHLDVEEVREALEHVAAIVEAIADDD